MKSYTKGKNVTREELTRQTHISTHAIMMTRQQKRWLSELTESIFTKWKWQLNMNGGFIRWINGNRIDYTPSNIVFVSPQDAMRNIDSWTVDWDMELDDDEIALVHVPSWRENIHFWTEPAGP